MEQLVQAFFSVTLVLTLSGALVWLTDRIMQRNSSSGT